VKAAHRRVGVYGTQNKIAMNIILFAEIGYLMKPLGSMWYNPTATLLEHALLAQGFVEVQEAAFPRCLPPQNRDSTCANLVEVLK
jgi:hypothetical protein